MEYYHLCTQCQKPTPDKTVNVVFTDIITDEGRQMQYYCPTCFPSVTKEVIAKNKKAKK
jgi:hypothetical protein